jgi:predicted PolB exonuclease-like 3'-5' exonuclease
MFSVDSTEGEIALITRLDEILSEPDDCSLPPFVVGFRSSSFDLPLLKLRAMRHGLSLGCLGPAGVDRYGKGRGRLSPRFHLDLAEEVLGYRRAPLDTVCDLLGIPTRHSVMPEGWTTTNGVDEDCRAFSELTLVVLHAIYLQWSLVINELNLKTFELSLQSFCDFLEREGEGRPHLSRWLGAYFAAAEETRMRDFPRFAGGLG